MSQTLNEAASIISDRARRYGDAGKVHADIAAIAGYAAEREKTMSQAPTRAHVCRDCKYWGGYLCHRYPPQIVLWPTGNQHPHTHLTVSEFPHVSADDWCGEWAGYTREEKF